ncbi:MAG: M1 family aminopeptidase [Pyrinomonadaceae bacterium]
MTKYIRCHPIALLFAVLFAFSSIGFTQTAAEAEVHKLPPVNWIRSRSIDVKHVAIDLQFDWERESAYGSTTVTLAPFKDSNLVNLDAAAMTISGVSIAGGSPLKYTYDAKKDNDNLEIVFDRTVKGGEDVSIKIEYRTNHVNTSESDTAIGGFGRGLRFIRPTDDEPSKPYQIWSQGETEFNRYWFPSYDSPNDFRTSELRATVDSKYTVVSNGRLVEDKDNGNGTRTFHWKMDIPYTNYLTSIVVGEYTDVKQEWNGIPISNYGYKAETKEVAATVKNLPDMVRFFSEITGVKYPYAKYAQSFVEDFGGGMENISATTMIEEMILDERELLDDDSDSLQAHELAHQWFGDYVTTREWGQIWLNESFATYFDALYQEHKQGSDEFLYTNVRGNQQSYFGSWNQGVRRPIVTKNYANKDAMFDAYAYPRGAAVLHMLRKHLGDEGFFRSLNRYLTQNAHQPVSTEDLRIAIEESTGQSMDAFFDQWLYKMGHPVFQVTQAYDAAGKTLKVTVKQTQKVDPKNEFPQVEYFQTYVDIAVDNKVERVWLKPQAENVFSFSSATKPRLVNFDYQGSLVKEMKFEKSVDDLVYQIQNDTDVLGRRWAMGEVRKKSTAANRIAIDTVLLNAAEKDTFWRNRRAALSEIAALYSPDTPPGLEAPAVKLDDVTTAVIERLTKDAKPLIRADALELLGETNDPKYADLYLSFLDDPSYTVVEQAASALGNTKSPKAFPALEKLVKTRSWRGKIAIAGLSGLAELGDKLGFDLAYPLATDKSHPMSVRAAALEVIGAVGKGDKRAYPLIAGNFKKALTDNDFNGIFRGITAIVDLADPRGQEAFDLLKEKFKNQANVMAFITMQESQFKAAIQE